MYFLRNLSSIAVERSNPWDFSAIDRVPADCLGKAGKTARSEWITAPKTDFQAYSLFEGVNANLRIRAGSSSEEGNPPVKMHGLAVDYDFPLKEEEIAAGLDRMSPDCRPQWRETTLSSNCRLVWLFHTPIALPSYAFAVAFLKSLDSVIPFRNLAGIDESALLAPERYYTNGCKWQKINPLPFPDAYLRGHLAKVSDKFDFNGPEFGSTLPLSAVIDPLRQKYPRFSEWPGDFVLGSAGPTFWIDGSESPKSAIVRETGIQTFAGHAPKPFFSWAELLGADLVNRFKTEQIGTSSQGIYYDEKHYFSKNGAGIWCIDPRENITLFLKQERGLSDTRKKGELTSEVERALVHIQRRNRIKTAAPFSFYPEGVTLILGESVLNTHTRRTISPAESAGPYPFLEEFLNTLFDPPEQLDYFLSWLSYYYKSCYRRAPRSGHAIFLAGGTNVGKTFLSRAVIGGLVGGFAEAHQFLTGADAFNSELFDCALWVIDDAGIASNFSAHKRFSENVKRIVANPTIRCNGKFLKANTVAWQGRVFVTLNTDPESSRILPDLDLSLREKIMILRTHEVAQIQFLPADEMESMLKRELPYLARFLLDYQTPKHCVSADPRFGVQPYLEKSLVDTANQSSVSGAFSEILEEWRRTFFMEHEPTAEKWEGTSLQLYKAILLDHTLVEAMKPFNLQGIGRMLASLASKKVFDIQVTGEDSRRMFMIPRDEARFPRRRSVIITQSDASKFEKK